MLAIASSVAPAPEPSFPLRARAHRRSEVDLLWVAAELGLLHHAPRTIIAKVRLLAEKAAFPLPKTPRFVNGERKTGAEAIDARSLWDKDAVELWLENDRPPPEAAQVASVRQSSVVQQLRERALQLVAANA